MPVHLDDVYGVLVEIRDLLRVLTEPPPEPEPVTECDHPEDHRLEFSTPRETRWRCQDCGYEYRSGRA